MVLTKSLICFFRSAEGEKLCGIIVENTFTSITDIVDSLFPMLAWKAAKKAFLRLNWDSIGKVRFRLFHLS